MLSLWDDRAAQGVGMKPRKAMRARGREGPSGERTARVLVVLGEPGGNR